MNLLRRLHALMTDSCSVILFVAMKIVLLLLVLTVAANAAERPSVGEIVSRMTAMNEARAAALHAFHNSRTYQVNYRGFPKTLSARATVTLQFSAPDDKHFTIVKQEGSGLLVSKVIKKALESEAEAAKPDFGKRSAVTEANYVFKFLRDDSENGRPCYLLQVTPKREDKYLYEGKICVDAADYAIARVDAKPAKNPSFWISRAHIESHSRKLGDFWFPASLHSSSHVRLGGDAELNIDYGDVEITSTSPVQPPSQ